MQVADPWVADSSAMVSGLGSLNTLNTGAHSANDEYVSCAGMGGEAMWDWRRCGIRGDMGSEA